MSALEVVISHDLEVVRRVADRVEVMYLGRIMEQGTAEEVFERPTHPYSRALLSSATVAEYGRIRQRFRLSGEIPSPIDMPAGCPLASRCPLVQPSCRAADPPMVSLSGSHQAACPITATDRLDPRRRRPPCLSLPFATTRPTNHTKQGSCLPFSSPSRPAKEHETVIAKPAPGRHRRLAPVAVIAALPIVLVACSSSSSTGTTGSTKTTSITTITTAWPADITTLDPANLSTGQDHELTRNIYQTLESPAFAQQPDGTLKFVGAQVKPELAKSWTLGKDSITYHLRNALLTALPTGPSARRRG